MAARTLNLDESAHDLLDDIRAGKSKAALVKELIQEHHHRVTNPRSPDVIVDRFDLFVLLGVCSGLGVDLNEYPTLVAAVKSMEVK